MRSPAGRTSRRRGIGAAALAAALVLAAAGCGRNPPQGGGGDAPPRAPDEPLYRWPVPLVYPPPPEPDDPAAAARIRARIFDLAADDFAERVRATDDLVREGAPAVPLLAGALRESDPVLRANAVNALCALAADPAHGPALRGGAVPTLVLALGDADAYVRILAAQTLGVIGDDRAVAPLIEALRDPHFRVRACARAALERITGRDEGPDARAWRRWTASARRG